jgi:N-acetylglucosaminyldiphosphoundecaprenol N-acetyl-beta-D-mannosaminyltransferase
MKNYFNINFEFDTLKIHKKVEKYISEKKKGYVCVVDGNVLTHSESNSDYNQILNSSMLNLCDGSSIAMLASKIHNEKLKAYTGPEIFFKYVKVEYKQCFLGNTEENLHKMKLKMQQEGYNIEHFMFMSLPFKNVQDFDYKNIAKEINDFKPDLIWVSLGAPKQEYFISRLAPLVEQGILFAIGAAFNFFLEEKKKDNSILERFNLIWLSRVLKEPKRVGGRALSYLFVLPKLILKEIKNKKN